MVWPHLAPGLAWLLAFVLSVTGWRQLIPFAGAAVVSAAVISANERGGFLLLVLLWGWAATAWIWRRLSSSTSRLATTARGSWASRLSYRIVAVALMAWLLLSLFVPAARRGGAFNDPVRLTMWSVGLNALANHDVFWGFGYASWPSAFRQAVANSESATLMNEGDFLTMHDTSHNFWVQLIFEHGLIGFLIIASLIGLGCRIAFRNAGFTPAGTDLVSLHVIAFLVCTSVQDFDFIRPVLMAFAVTWGTLLGLPFDRSPERVDDRAPVFRGRPTVSPLLSASDC